MKKYIFSVFLTMLILFTAVAVPISVPSLQGEAYAQFPSFISGSESKIVSTVNSKGKSTLSILSLIGILVCAACIIFGCIKMASNNAQGAKGYLVGSGAALIIIGLLYSFVVFYGKL